METRIINGYVWIHLTTKHKNRKKWVRFHRYIWEEKFGKIPDGFSIHHKDKNPQNNDIENLECLSRSEHSKLHSGNMSKETLEKKRLSMLGKNTYKRTEETRKKIGDAQKGRKLSEETKHKISNGNRGKIITEETRKKLSKSLIGLLAKKVMNIETGEVFIGLKKAAQSIGVTSTAIAHAANGICKTCGGYHWKYIDT